MSANRPEELQRTRVLTPGAFRRLLEWLDNGVESHGDTYIEMRQRLVAYFDRRNRLSPDELADETLNRVAIRLEESGVITVTPPARYCYIVAKFVFLEDLRKSEHTNVSLDQVSGSRADAVAARVATPAQPEPAVDSQERRLQCLERCLQQLPPEHQQLILDYYREARRAKIESRREIAARLGVTMNALSIRACRIRNKLEACVQACSQEE
jgi:DNA-directed RNA polymerase specialized sigma24 family protein